MPTRTFTFQIQFMNIKTIKQSIDKVAKTAKFAMYVIMVTRIVVALYLRVHKGLDDEDYE